MSYPSRLALLLCLGPSLPFGAQAGQAVDEGLAEVIVTARSLEVSTPLALSTFGYDVEFLSAEQIRESGFVDASQALQFLVPGVYLSTQMGAFSYINLALQGSRTSDVLWTVDGVRINNRLYNGTSPADTLPAGMIERMEVLKGGQGVLYGTQAAAGVINIATRAFSEEFGGEASLGGNTNAGGHANGYVRGSLGRNRFVAWASRDQSDGFMLYDQLQPDSTTRDRRYDVVNYGLKYGFDFSGQARVTVQAIHTEAALDYPNPGYTDVNDRDEDLLMARLDLSPSQDLDIYLKGYFHDWDTDYYPATDPADTAFWGFRDVGFTAMSRLHLSRGLDYFVGYDFQSYEGRDEVLLIDQHKEQVNALYAQVRSTDELSEHARFTAGVRYNDTGGVDATVWSLSGTWEFNRSLFVSASLGTSFLLPDIYQLYAVDPFDTHGNPDLEPEESVNYNLSVGGRAGAGWLPLEWRIAGWYRTIENLITDTDVDPPPGFDTVFINSDARTRATGFEAVLGGPLGRDLDFSASYTYSSEEDEGTNAQLPNRPLHSAKLGLGWEPGGGRYGATLSLFYAGSMHANVTGFGRQDYGDYVIADLGAHVFMDSGHRHRLALRVENLFDTDYETRIRSTIRSGSVPPTRFIYRNLGAPVTGFVTYSYRF
jgi:outer membrane cobalamin receptor